MLISEIISMLEKEKEKHGDVQVVQFCSSEELIMPIRGTFTFTNKEDNDATVLSFDDDNEYYFYRIPPLKSERK